MPGNSIQQEYHYDSLGRLVEESQTAPSTGRSYSDFSPWTETDASGTSGANTATGHIASGPSASSATNTNGAALYLDGSGLPAKDDHPDQLTGGGAFEYDSGLDFDDPLAPS